MPIRTSVGAYASATPAITQQFEALYEGLNSSFKHEARKYARSWHDQEDLARAAMFGVARALSRYNPNGTASLRTYLYNCGVNAMIDEARYQRSHRERRRNDSSEPSAGDQGPHPLDSTMAGYVVPDSINAVEIEDKSSPEDELIADQTRNMLAVWRSGLTKVQAIVLEQHICLDEPIKAIAKRIGCSHQALYQVRASLLSKAAQRFAL
jgi:RNA polymerase sigma factor (sigma-70 family)